MPTQTRVPQIPAEAQTCHQGGSPHHVIISRATTSDASQTPWSARVIRRCRYHGGVVTPDVTLHIVGNERRMWSRGPVFRNAP